VLTAYSRCVALSYSQLRTYRACPRQYEFQVIKKLPRGISEAESFGSSVHNCLKKWGELEMSHKPLAFSHQQTMFAEKNEEANGLRLTANKLLELWHRSFILNTYPTRIEADHARQRGEQLMQKFYEWWSQEPLVVLAVEQSFKFVVDGTQISGRMDRVERVQVRDSDSSVAQEGIRVIDFKTSRPQDIETVHADLQLSIYALAVQELYEQPCAELVLLYLSEDQVVERKTSRSAGQLTDARKQIANLKESMDEQDFHPTPSAGVCRCCPYKGVCNVAAA